MLSYEEICGYSSSERDSTRSPSQEPEQEQTKQAKAISKRETEQRHRVEALGTGLNKLQIRHKQEDMAKPPSSKTSKNAAKKAKKRAKAKERKESEEHQHRKAEWELEKAAKNGRAHIICGRKFREERWDRKFEVARGMGLDCDE